MTATAVTIRPAVREDVPAVAGLIEEIERFYGATDIERVAVRRAQTEQALFGAPPLAHALVAETEDGDIAGLAAYSFLWPATNATHSLFLKELYVREPLRQQGVGARLMAELRAIAAARPGCSRMEWMTDSTNPSARRFYKSLGFAEYEGKIIYRITPSSPATRPE
ncbi:cyclophane-containing RiPP N-acetyltransferase HaaN [Streptomyces sp. ITFR-16]|uniref:cyclophane-containing RiPP N-acetyltransferase HaaN n=1 Tax=Streptomyces sp. ITFR-16 TaxID=3075198 RepID=UPI00288A8B09|nr:cyclophane-containing RiPP N-acetyltransferase HaaN [Streptomyces sp. ITFR-16]WNI24581.1 cyclophane-containing RiPP N-acetyltransferase HaaN [Streptomyces sp. ITFR-16]